jgi:microcystin-dependent protein
MSAPFVAEIRIVTFNFPPKGWAFCNGQLIPISQNTALFSLLGTTYGGDGKSTFSIPDLQGNAPLFWGQGAGLSLYDEGQLGGEAAVTLLQSEMPAHSHNAFAADPANTPDHISSPSTASWGAGGRRGTGQNLYAPSGGGNVQMSPLGTAVTGGSLPHNNMPPYLVLNFIIALQGIFPPRS